MMSTWLLQMAMNGLSQSPSPTPVARRRLRWAARESPFLIVSERIFGPSGSLDIGNEPLVVAGVARRLRPELGMSRTWGEAKALAPSLDHTRNGPTIQPGRPPGQSCRCAKNKP